MVSLLEPTSGRQIELMVANMARGQQASNHLRVVMVVVAVVVFVVVVVCSVRVACVIWEKIQGNL